MNDKGGGRRRGSGKKGVSRSAAASPASTGIASNGWTLLAHPLFLDQLESLTARAAKEPAEDEAHGPATKLLAHVLDLVFDTVPQNPASPAYRHGGSVGGANREWFRAKTGNGRFRLFFRFHSRERIIVYGWLNDEQSLRTYGARTDAYAVFARMLKSGNPPADWAALRAAASTPSAAKRFGGAAARRGTKRAR